MEETGLISNKILKQGVIIIVLALGAGNLGESASRYKREFLYSMGMIARDDFIRPYGKWGSGDICPRASEEVAHYIQNNTYPEDPILVFSIEPGLYVMSNRYPRTRFAYDQPLTANTRGDEKFSHYQEKLRAQFISDVENFPPVYIIVVEKDASYIESKDSYAQMQEFKTFNELVSKNYYLETKIEHYYLYKLKPGSRLRFPAGVK